MNSLEIRRDEVKDTKNAADCKFFTGDMQDFAVEVIYYMTESGSTRLKRGDLQVGRTRMQGWPYKKIEVIREGIRFRTSTVLKS